MSNPAIFGGNDVYVPPGGSYGIDIPWENERLNQGRLGRCSGTQPIS